MRALRGLMAALLVGVLAWAVLHLTAAPPDALALNTLRRGNGAEAESLDPQAARSEAALTIARDLFEGLMAQGPGGAPVPAAAERVEVSGDGLRYTFHLREGLRWSNGDRLEAADFVAAWRRLVDPATAAPYAQMLAAVRHADDIIAGRVRPAMLDVQASDARTLVVNLVQPTPHFLKLLTHPASFPLHRASLAAHGNRFAKPGILVSNGAYGLSRWDFGSKIVVVRNRYYWNDAHTRIARVEYHSIAQATSELSAYRAGSLDITSTLPTPQLPWIREHLAAELHVSPQLAVYYYALNLKAPPFANSPALRRALSMVIDREQLVRSVTGLGEAPAFTLVPSLTQGYAPPLPEYATWPMPRRIERARELLRESATPLPRSIELRFNSGDLHSRIALAVASMWKQALGIDTVLRAEEFKVLLQAIERRDGLQVFRASWVADYDDAYGFLQLLRSDFGINLPGYANPQYDALLDAANRAPQEAQRAALLQQAEALMLADQPVIPLYTYVSKRLVKPRVLGWRDNVMNIVYSKDLSLKAAG
jgi:oligopeptide transport system substrate-binding protein